FGIAKALEIKTASGPQSPVLTTPAMTMAGMILGTAAYMSPEQARGKDVDQRADIWAFGCILYEMLTGQPAFGGEDVPLTLARVLSLGTDMTSLPDNLAPVVRQTIELCLEKDPKKRIADIRDVRLALNGRFGVGAGAPGAEGVHAPMRGFWRRALPLTATALVLGGLVVGTVLWQAMQPSPQPVNRFASSVPDTHQFLNTLGDVLAVSPDGRRFVYNTSEGLYLRELGALQARLIPGTAGENAAAPFFSPDGQSIAYVNLNTQQRQMKRIAISGGAPVIIADTGGSPYGAHWAADGSIYFSQQNAILRVPATGGTPELLIEAQGRLASPELLPDGDTLLFSAATTNWDGGQIIAQSLSTGVRTVLIQGGSNAHYVATGHLIYALGGNLFAIAFDMATLSVSGGAVPVVEGVMRGTLTDAANYGITADGSLFYLEGTAQGELRTLVWVDRSGGETAIPIEPSNYFYPRISPNGLRVALDDRNTANDIWIWDFAAQTRMRLSTGSAGGQYPVWTVDGTSIAFRESTTSSITLRAANNTGQTTTLLTSQPDFDGISPYFFSASGQELVFRNVSTTSSGDDLLMLSLNAEVEPVGLLQEAYTERNAELSPNGRWMAYQSNESGSGEIYVRPFPNVDDDKVQVSNAGGIKPLWSRDGSELFYLQPGSGTPQLMVVSVQTDGATFAFGSRTALLDWPYYTTAQGREYDVSLDGQQFLAIKAVVSAEQEQSSRQIIVVQNWVEELKRLVPR
ncbi:MAG: protein kinase, partial [Pseudohongiellaceae bacterium]